MAPPSKQARPARARMRRVPRQARGKQRVEGILDAAAALFSEIGVEATTTNAIAARAETSIGSIYQFFPNKQAVLHALNARYVDQLRAICDSLLVPGPEGESLAALVERIVRTLHDFHARHPGFQAVFYGAHGTADLSEAAQTAAAEIVDRLDALFAAREPNLEPARRALAAAVCLEVMKALLALATRPGADAEAVMAEARALLCGYLEPLIGG